MSDQDLQSATDALYAAEESVRRAGTLVNDLKTTVKHALRVLDDAELESAKARLSGRSATSGELLAEDVIRLQASCADIAPIARDLTQRLDEASSQVVRAAGILDEHAAAPGERWMSRAGVELGARVAVIADLVAVAGPMAHTAAEHAASASEAGQRLVSSPTIEPAAVDRALAAAGTELGRADEDARILEDIVDRVATSAHRSVVLAEEVSEEASRARLRDHTHNQLAGSAGAAAPRR